MGHHRWDESLAGGEPAAHQLRLQRSLDGLRGAEREAGGTQRLAARPVGEHLDLERRTTRKVVLQRALLNAVRKGKE